MQINFSSPSPLSPHYSEWVGSNQVITGNSEKWESLYLNMNISNYIYHLKCNCYIIYKILGIGFNWMSEFCFQVKEKCTLFSYSYPNQIIFRSAIYSFSWTFFRPTFNSDEEASITTELHAKKKIKDFCFQDLLSN